MISDHQTSKWDIGTQQQMAVTVLKHDSSLKARPAAEGSRLFRPPRYTESTSLCSDPHTERILLPAKTCEHPTEGREHSLLYARNVPGKQKSFSGFCFLGLHRWPFGWVNLSCLAYVSRKNGKPGLCSTVILEETLSFEGP